jgi:hypothetical protein
MTGTDLCVNNSQFVPVIFEPPCILSIALFVVNNKNYFQTNAEIRDINTRTKSNLHQALSHLSKYQKGTHCFGIKVFNNLPARIKDLFHNIRQFESALRAFLYSHSFYTLDEYFNYNKTKLL